MTLRRLTVLGLGLMGGSVARAARARRPDLTLVAWTPDGKDAESGLRAGVIDIAATSLAEAVAATDLVVLAAPVGASVALLGELSGVVPPRAALTDVCSVMRPLLAAAQAGGLGDRFVGAHPYCGSHRSGWEAARADLFDDCNVFTTPAPDAAITEVVESFWRLLGARIERIGPADHDALMAHASHLPQIVSSAVGTTLARRGIPRGRLGPGGLDVTRLSASSPGLWSDLLLHNRDEVIAALGAARVELSRFAEAVEMGDPDRLAELLRVARVWSEPTS